MYLAKLLFHLALIPLAPPLSAPRPWLINPNLHCPAPKCSFRLERETKATITTSPTLVAAGPRTPTSVTYCRPRKHESRAEVNDGAPQLSPRCPGYCRFNVPTALTPAIVTRCIFCSRKLYGGSRPLLVVPVIPLPL
jgi:hypothetical protein